MKLKHFNTQLKPCFHEKLKTWCLTHSAGGPTTCPARQQFVPSLTVDECGRQLIICKRMQFTFDYLDQIFL